MCLKKYSHKFLLLVCFIVSVYTHAQQVWPDNIILTPEKTDFLKTSTHQDVMNFLSAIQKLSKNIYVFSMGNSLEGKQIPVAVLSKPRIDNAIAARASGKNIVYIQGNIHAGEVEGKEAVMMLMRDILLGDKKYLLDSLIIILVPIYNTDSNDKMAKGLRPSQEDSPPETGERESSEGYDLNRDGIKMDAIETRSLITQVINPWDPQVFVDIHTTNGTWHAYSLTWAPSYFSAGAYQSFDYTLNKMLPTIADSMKSKYNLLTGPYGDYYLNEGWPPKNFYSYNHHPRYLVNYMGFRNRIAILSEAFAHERFYQRIHSSYSFVSEILDYSFRHATEIINTNKLSEKASIENVMNNAGKLSKGTHFQMKTLYKIKDFITYDYIQVDSKDSIKKFQRTGKIVSYKDVNYHAKFEATKSSLLPSGYIIEALYSKIVENLKQHGVVLRKLKKDTVLSGYIYMADSVVYNKVQYQKHHAASCFGGYIYTQKKFKKGDYIVDMNQPLTNLIFYLLEPESDDGLLYWNFFDEYIQTAKKVDSKIEIPVFKYINK